MQSRGYWARQNFTFRDVLLGPDAGHSLWQTCPYPALLDPSVGFGFHEDFWRTPLAGEWILTEDAGKTGPDVLLDSVGGIYQLFADGDNNDESYLELVSENFLVRAGKPIWFEASVYGLEADTDKANLIVGLSAAPGADHILDNGGGPPANYQGAVWFKRDSNLYWEFEVSNGATQVTKANQHVYASGVAHKLGFFISTAALTDTIVTVYPSFDGVVDWANGCALTIAALTEWKPFFGLKSGATGAEESICVDYIRVVAAR